MSDRDPIVILVPQGAEYQAVLRGLQRISTAKPESPYPVVIPIPMGPAPVSCFLDKRHQVEPFAPNSTVLLMGLGGSLAPDLTVGAIALVDKCMADWIDAQEPLQGDRSVVAWLEAKLEHRATRVQGLTSTRLISSVREKTQLHQSFNALIVDMEGYNVLQFCQVHGLRGGIVRVVSDGCLHDVPDVNNAITAEGTLQTLPLALGFLRHPMGAMRLIRGSLTGLKILKTVTHQLFQHQ